ncbi:MAG TPA: zinc-binding dehydrogenase [Candidatus Acidoferrales bacterium]|nr:zinc-binding dehydrogenase [Candidatus Acidoferrales bacterium]
MPAAAALTAERYYAQCDDANPNGKDSGTAFLGGPKTSGPFDGLQAEYACVPFAHVGLVRLPDEVSDDQAILISDIFPTGYFGADIANVHDGSTVVIFGCGPVGQFTIASCKLLGAGRIFAVDTIASRLQMASEQGAETIDFNSEDPVETILELTNGIGVDKAIDAVGVDAVHPSKGPAHKAAQDKEFQTEVKEIVSKSKPDGDNWHPGDAPSQVVKWAVESLAKVGTLSVIGVYPEAMQTFPLGNFMEKNLTLRAGNCNHRKYVPKLVDLARMGQVNPAEVLTQAEPITSAIEAYKLFDRRAPGWVKVELKPAVADVGDVRYPKLIDPAQLHPSS